MTDNTLAASDMPTTFAAAIRELRTRRNITQIQLAKAAGLSQSFLSQLEVGERQPRLATVRRLATALDVPASDLFATLR